MHMSVTEMNRMIRQYNEGKPDSLKKDTLDLTFDMDVTTGGVDEIKLDIFIRNHTEVISYDSITNPVEKNVQAWQEKKRIRIKVRPMLHIFPEEIYGQPVGGWKTLTEIKQMMEDNNVDPSGLPLSLDEDTIRIYSNIYNWFNNEHAIPFMQVGCSENDSVKSIAYDYEWGHIESMTATIGDSSYQGSIDHEDRHVTFRFPDGLDFSSTVLNLQLGEDSSVISPGTDSTYNLSDTATFDIYDGGKLTASYTCIAAIDLKIFSFKFYLEDIADTVHAKISHITNSILLQLPETATYKTVSPQIKYSSLAILSPSESSSLTLDGAQTKYTLTYNGQSVNYRLSYAWYDPLGINPEEDYQICLYPNPASTRLYIHGLPANYKVSLALRSMDGRLISRQLAKTDAQIDVSGLPPGIYILQLTDEKNQRACTKKIAIMR
jgi:hypothetical protein